MRKWILGAAVVAVLGGLFTVAGLAVGRAPRERPSGPAATATASSGWARPERAPPPPVAPSAEELSLVSPLAPGSPLAGFEVREIQGVRDGAMRVVCGKDKAVVRLDIALVDDDGVVPPATAGKFAVFYSVRGALPEEGDRLARKLAEVLKAHADAAPPPGMTKFQPREKPGVDL